MHIVLDGGTGVVVGLGHDIAVFDNHQSETGVGIVELVGGEMTSDGTTKCTGAGIVGDTINVEGQEARNAVNLRHILLDASHWIIDTRYGTGFFSVAMVTVDHHSGSIGATTSIVEEGVFLIGGAGQSIDVEASVMDGPDSVSAGDSLLDAVVTTGAVATGGTGELFENAGTGNTSRSIINHGSGALEIVFRRRVFDTVGVGDGHRDSVAA